MNKCDVNQVGVHFFFALYMIRCGLTGIICAILIIKTYRICKDVQRWKVGLRLRRSINDEAGSCLISMSINT